VIGRGDIHGALCRLQRVIEGVRGGIEPVDIPIRLEDREHGPAVGRIRRLFDRAFERGLGGDLLFSGDAFGVTEATQQRFVWRKQGRVFAAHSEAHGVRKDAIPIRDCGDDARNEVVLKIEDCFGIERPLVRFRPQSNAAGGVAELDRDPEPGARLTNAPLHDVASTNFLADRADVARFAGILRGGATRDHAKVGKPRKSCDDFLQQSFGESLQIGAATCVAKRQHGDPEAFLGAGRARICSDSGVRRRWRKRRGARSGSRQVAELVAYVARRLHAVPRIFLKAAANDACEVGRQFGARIGDRRRSIAQNRRNQFSG
jgi:hypothetical protein